MGKLITDNETLMRYLPNALATIDGERSYFDRVSPFIDDAEAWLEAHITPIDIVDAASDRLANAARAFVGARALENALPALDVVATPNGFGIVSNNNLSPASRERMDKLARSMTAVRCERLASLMDLLRLDNTWRSSSQALWLAESMVQRMVDTVPTGYADRYTDRWDAFLALRQDAAPYESEIALEFISPELYGELCRDFEPGTGIVKHHVHSAVLDAVRTGHLDRRGLVAVVDYIRDRPEQFPAWFKSHTAGLFEDHSFKNKKHSAGYFF